MKTDHTSPQALLTEADLVVGNRFECIEDSIYELADREAVHFIKGEIYTSLLKNCIYCDTYNVAFVSKRELKFLNRHFKLSPPQVMDEQGNISTLLNKIDQELIISSRYQNNNITIPKEYIRKLVKNISALQSANDKLKELLKDIDKSIGIGIKIASSESEHNLLSEIQNKLSTYLKQQ